MHGRVDLTEEAGPDAMAAEIARLERAAQAWPEPMRLEADQRVTAVERLNAEAFRRLIAALRTEPGCASPLREAAADPVVYAVLRRHGILKPSLQERVEAALESVRPTLAQHGGDVELVRVEPPVAELRLIGACDGCPASALTFYAGLKQAVLDQVKEITEVRQVSGGAASRRDDFIRSPFAEGWIAALPVEALEEGKAVPIEAAGERLLLARIGGEVRCFLDACAHLGLPFTGAQSADGMITCPHHGFRYELDSGGCLDIPEVQLQPRPARIDGDMVHVRPRG